MAEKEGAIIKKGHEEAFSFALTLLEEFELPLELLPLENVSEIGFVRSTGYVWGVQKQKVEHTFRKIGILVKYDTEVNGYLERKKIRKLKGVKSKYLMFWYPISAITVDDPPTGNIHFKALLANVPCPIEAFSSGQ